MKNEGKVWLTKVKLKILKEFLLKESNRQTKPIKKSKNLKGNLCKTMRR